MAREWHEVNSPGSAGEYVYEYAAVLARAGEELLVERIDEGLVLCADRARGDGTCLPTRLRFER
jgi:hypothetical protein